MGIEDDLRRRVEEQMRSGPAIGQPGDSRAAVRVVTARNVRRVMESMGFAEGDIAPAVESVEVTAARDGQALDVSFDAPERVVAFMDAVSAGDFERAELVMSAREG